MAGEKVLIVDDNETNLKLLRVLLAQGGYDVRTATNGEQALAAISASPPSLVLMDIQLPDTDGLEVTRQLKSAPATKDICVVAITAYAMKGDKQKALAAGCDGYITKPIDTRSLLPVVAKVLSEHSAAEPRGAPP